MRRTIELNGFDTVASGQKSNLFIRQAYAYHELLLLLTGITSAQIEYIALYLESTEIQRWSGTALDKLNQFKGLAAAGGAILKLPFTRIGMLERNDEYPTAIHLGVPDAQKFMPTVMRLEVKLATGISGTPALAAKAIVDEAMAGNPGWVMFVKQSNFDVQGTERVLNTLVSPGDPQTRFLDMFVFESSAVTQVEVQRDGRDFFKRTKAENDRQQLDGVRTPQTGYFVLDTGENGFGTLADAMEVFSSKEVKFRVTTSAPATVGTYAVSIGTLA